MQSVANADGQPKLYADCHCDGDRHCDSNGHSDGNAYCHTHGDCYLNTQALTHG